MTYSKRNFSNPHDHMDDYNHIHSGPSNLTVDKVINKPIHYYISYTPFILLYIIDKINYLIYLLQLYLLDSSVKNSNLRYEHGKLPITHEWPRWRKTMRLFFPIFWYKGVVAPGKVYTWLITRKTTYQIRKKKFFYQNDFQFFFFEEGFLFSTSKSRSGVCSTTEITLIIQ